MPRTATRGALVVTSLMVGLLWLTVGVSGQNGQPSTTKGEWPHYNADLRGTRYSPLDQINASNFNQLEVAWRFKTDNFGPFPEYKLEGTPLMVNGVLYTTAGTRRSVIALDAKNGELIWSHSYREGRRAANSPRQLSGRGVAYWTDGKGEERVLYVTTGYRLIALNAKTGSMIPSFGTNGVVDLKVGVVKGINEQIDLETGEIGVHSTPTIVGDIAIIGAAMREGATVPSHNNTKGVIRAFNVRTGRMVWRFDTIPRPGEFGNETWENGSWATNGNVGVWNQPTVDEELGLVYLPVETPTSDYYGGHRPGNNLFAESIVAVEVKTGKRRWHYQLVHHPLWNYDMPAPPIIADVMVDGKPRKIVAQLTKQAWVYVLDRVTGQPIWPIEERPVPQSDVPGEKTSPTQPHVIKPPAYAREFMRVPDDLIDFTPDLRAKAQEIIKRYRVANTPFNPPMLGDVKGMLGAIVPATATNWPGGGLDPENGIIFAPAGNTFGVRTLVAPPAGYSDIRYVSGVAGRPFVEVWGPGDCCAADAGIVNRENLPQRYTPPAGSPPPPPVPGLNVDGLPVSKPPYGLLAAVDLNRGELLWQTPHGDTPDNIRNHAALKGMNIPKTGQPGTSGVGLVVTKALVIMGDPQITTPPGRPRGAMLRAYDKTTGKEVGALLMPAIQSGSPMTYMLDGKQYIIVAVSGGNYSGEYLAFALPNADPKRETR
jgi:quinoprotein glucose dehydrogenase